MKASISPSHPRSVCRLTSVCSPPYLYLTKHKQETHNFKGGFSFSGQ